MTAEAPERLRSPAVLVTTTVLAEQRILLLKRGTPPYQGKWAPPGGFVEAGESLERAAVREVEEEVGIALSPRQLVPHAIVSLPALSQVYVCFIAVLEVQVPPQPSLPEALDARWFSEAEFPHADCWDPQVALASRGFDVSQIYARAREGIFEFYQHSDDFVRVFSGPCQVHYVADRTGSAAPALATALECRTPSAAKDRSSLDR